MPCLTTARRIYNTKSNNAQTMGQALKNDSDYLMESTWWNDPQAKKAYIYDYFHDDQPERARGMTYENTTKTPIDVKFIVKSYQSIDKDQVEFYLQFRPSQKFDFEQGDDLYYFETDCRQKYKVEFPIGLYVDLPDSRGVYEKWIIVDKEYANQFQKFLILPCDYQLMWIEKRGKDRIKRKMWSILRNQSSYNCMRFILEIICRKFSNCWNTLKLFTLQHNDEKYISVKV